MASEPDETLTTILAAIAPENHLGVLLAAQMGGTPQEVQIILQTADYDEDKEALRPTGQYIIRAIGVVEHRLSVGLFGAMVLAEENPLLFAHNEKIMQVYFQSQPENIDSLLIDINQLYAQTYGRYDPFRRMADELNPTMPLATLLNAGRGLLGEMPEPFANTIRKVFERHGIKTNFIESEDHRPPMQFQLLVMDDSYIIAQMFSADPMGK
jgi:hypothetical protein